MSNAKLKLFQKAKEALLADYKAKEKELSSLKSQLEQHGIIIVGGKTKTPAAKKRTMSKAGRAAIAKAQKARWAKVKAAGK